jgi:putative endonuclease
MTSTKSVGDLGERIAMNLVKEKGYNILDKNFRSRFGEIDIISKDQDDIVFIEVKTRHGVKYGKPIEAVTKDKLKKIKKTIDYYFLLNKIQNHRIEVITILFSGDGSYKAEIMKVVD